MATDSSDQVDVISKQSPHAIHNYKIGYESGTNAGAQIGVVHGDVVYNYVNNHKQDQVGFSMEECICRANELIKDHYLYTGCRVIKRLSGHLLSLENCYINLALVDRSVLRDNEKQEFSASVETRLRLDASDIGQSISLEDLFKSRELADGKTINPRRIFIQGRAGIGKTTLCKKVICEVTDRRLGAALFDRLLFVPLRGLGLEQGQDKYGWRELLRDTFKTENEEWRGIEEVYSNRFGDDDFLRRTLFLFDGMDEISHRWKDEKPLFQFINKIVHTLPNIIVTSRPRANTFTFDIELETVGFRIDQISTYIQHCVDGSETIAKMERTIARKPLIRGLLRIPVLLDAFCYAWDEDDTSGVEDSVTMTTLYQSITIELCMKDLRRLEQLDQVEGKLCRELALLGEIAFQGLLSGVLEFGPQHRNKLKNYLLGHDAEDIFSPTLDRLSFLRSSDPRKDYTKRTYHFIHRTFQEFFAARHFVEHWRNQKPLKCIQLIGLNGSESKQPLLFLQEKKYNPGYDIFWRFVAGLLELQPAISNDTTDEQGCNGVDDFFKGLNTQPKDLFESAHRRLLMCCTSELIGSDQNIQTLKRKEEELLRQWTIKEYLTCSALILGREAEFPEEILCEFLFNNGIIPHDAVLSALYARTFIAESTFEIVYSLMLLGSTGTMQQLKALVLNILLKHSRGSRDPYFTQVIETLKMFVFDGSPAIRKSAIRNLRWNTSPPLALQLLIELQQDEDPTVSMAALTAVHGVYNLSLETITVLLERLSDNKASPVVRYHAALTLRRLSPLPEEIFTSLITMLDSDDSSLWEYSLEALHYNVTLPYPAITAIIARLQDGNHDVRNLAALHLQERHSLEKEVLKILINMLTHTDAGISSLILTVLIKQSSPPLEAFEKISTMLQCDILSTRETAAAILKGCSCIPPYIVTTLARLLKDSNHGTIVSLIDMWNACSQVPQEIMACMLGLLAAPEEEIKESVFRVLRAQSSLPADFKSALLERLEDETIWVQFCAVEVLLMAQSRPPREAVLKAIEILGNEDHATRVYAIRELGKQFRLPKEVIAILVEEAKRGTKESSEQALHALSRQENLSYELISPLASVFQVFEIFNAPLGLGIVSVLGRCSTLPMEIVKELIASLRNPDSIWREEILSTLERQSSLSPAAISDLVMHLPGKERGLCHFLHRRKEFWSALPNLENQTWERLWKAWYILSIYDDFRCYELHGSLCIWWQGKYHQIERQNIRTVADLLR